MTDLFRRLCSLTLSLAILLPAQGFAREGAVEHPLPPEQWESSPLDRERFLKLADEKIDAMHGETPAFDHAEIQKRIERGMMGIELKSQRPNIMAHNAEMMMQLWILAFVHSVYQQNKMQPLTGRKTSVTETMAITADQLINGFDVYASSLGSLATSFALQKPMEALRKGLAATGTRQGLQTLVSSGATSFVTFVGWEAGESLWQEAIFQLPEEDMRIAKDLRFVDVLFSHNTNAAQYKVLGKIMNNAFKILRFADPQMSRNWIYNTWRLKIATGGFITTLTSMVSFGVLAGSIAPGEGNLIGFCFGFAGGLVGGAVAMMLPDEWNDAITDSIRAKRVNNGWSNLQQNTFLLKRYQDFVHKRGAQDQTDGFDGFMKYRVNYRNDIATALIEQIYGAYVKIQEADVILGLVKSKSPVNFVKGAAFDAYVNPENLSATPALAAPSADIAEIGAKFLKQKSENIERLKYFFDQLIEMQKREAITLGGFAYDPNPNFPDILKMATTSAIADQQTVHLALREMYVGLLPDKLHDFPEMKDWKPEDLQQLQNGAQILLNVYYLRGFNEADLK